MGIFFAKTSFITTKILVKIVGTTSLQGVARYEAKQSLSPKSLGSVFFPSDFVCNVALPQIKTYK